MEESKLCRCRQRIPAPVIMVKGKTIARSAALSDAIEIAYETFSFSPLSDEGRKAVQAEHSKLDVNWLQTLRIKHICDFMLEDSRKMFENAFELLDFSNF